MAPRNALEWIAGGNAPRTKKSLRKNETIQVTIATVLEKKPEPVSESQPETASRDEMAKTVHFEDENATEKSTKNDGNEKNKGVQKEVDACMCECKVCRLGSSTGGKGKEEKEKDSGSQSAGCNNNKQNNNKKETHHKQNAYQNNNNPKTNNHKQNNQSSNAHFSLNNAYASQNHHNHSSSCFSAKSNDNYNNPSNNIHSHAVVEDHTSAHYASYIRRTNMSRLIQPPRSEVIIREDVIETPTDPKPNAFFDARVGLLRVYHGPVYGNALGSLTPVGAGMSMPNMGGLGLGAVPPVMSRAAGGWPPELGNDGRGNGPVGGLYWTPISGPGVATAAFWPGGQREGVPVGRGVGFEEVRIREGEGSGGGGNNGSGWKEWRNGKKGGNRDEQINRERSSRSGDDRQGSSGVGECEGSGNGGNHSNDENRNRNNSNNSLNWNNDSNNNGNRNDSNDSTNWNNDPNNNNNNEGNDEWGDNNGVTNNDHQSNNDFDSPSNNNAPNDSMLNNDSSSDVEAFSHLPGAWNDHDDYSNDHDQNHTTHLPNNSTEKTSGWYRPATPPNWTAERGNAHDYDYGCDDNNNESNDNGADADWGGETSNFTNNNYDSGSSHYKNNLNNTSSSSPVWRPVETGTALSGGSWAEKGGTGPIRNNGGGGGGGGSSGNWKEKSRDGNGGGGGNGNGSSKGWRQPKTQAKWADPNMAAQVSGSKDNGGAGKARGNLWS